MPTRDRKQAALLAAARAILDVDRAAAVTVVVALGRAVLIADGPPTAAPAPPDPSTLPRLQRVIYDALAGGPLSARTLARQVRRKYNSYFRSVLGRMVRAGLIRRVAAGYARQEVHAPSGQSA